MLRYVDPDGTTTAEIEGVSFTVGFWPPRESERIARDIAVLQAAEDKDSDAWKDRSAVLCRRMVQYGVRGWAGWEGAPEAVFEDEEIHGRKHKRLDPRLLDGVALSGALQALALACLGWNNLQESEKKTSGEPSGSGTTSQRTDARPAAAAPPSENSRGKTTTATGNGTPARGQSSRRRG